MEWNLAPQGQQSESRNEKLKIHMEPTMTDLLSVSMLVAQRVPETLSPKPLNPKTPKP